MKTLLILLPGTPPPSYWPELGLSKTFLEIQETLGKCRFTVETSSETYDVKNRLRDRFTNSSNRHWRENADVFSLLEACLQPYGPKRIAAKEALKMSFLVGRVVSSKIDQTHPLEPQKSGNPTKECVPQRPRNPPRKDAVSFLLQFCWQVERLNLSL